MTSKSSNGLYIHIPFCAAKCDYCDFLSFADKQNQWTSYKDALIAELSKYNSNIPIDTIYIGGGTPTVWPASFLSELFQALPPTLSNAEITCEANPGTLTAEKISVLSSGGVNRISLGLQACQPRLLENIGRQTAYETFLENFYELRRAGFNNINIDIMFALPHQKLADWEETLHHIVVLKPEHISAYALTPEENTPLWSSYGENICDEETDRLMYHRCKAFLQECGYIQYELSNFCKPGYESRHNLRYWTRKPYLGFGLGAHSFDGQVRWHNTTDLQLYLVDNLVNNKTPFPDQTRHDRMPITKAEAMAEFMFLGLRMTNGVSVTAFLEAFDQWPHEVYGPWISQMKTDSLLQEKDEHIFLTDYGMDLANRVMAGFLE